MALPFCLLCCQEKMYPWDSTPFIGGSTICLQIWGTYFWGTTAIGYSLKLTPGGKAGRFRWWVFQRGYCRRSLQMPVSWSERIKGPVKQVDDPLGWSTHRNWRGDLGIHAAQGPKVTSLPNHLPVTWGCQVLNLTTFRCERFRKFFFKQKLGRRPKDEANSIGWKTNKTQKSQKRQVLGSFCKWDESVCFLFVKKKLRF